MTIPNLAQHLAYFKNTNQRFMEQKTGKAGNIYMKYTKGVQAFLHDLEQSGIELNFDWTNEAVSLHQYLAQPTTIASADKQLIQKLFTYLMRQERSMEGTIDVFARNGAIFELLTWIDHQANQASKFSSTDKKACFFFGIFLIVCGISTLIWLSQSLSAEHSYWSKATIISTKEDIPLVSPGQPIIVTGHLRSIATTSSIPFVVYKKYLYTHEYGFRPKQSTASTKWNPVGSFYSESSIIITDNTSVPIQFQSQTFHAEPIFFTHHREVKQTIDGRESVVDVVNHTYRYDGFMNNDLLTIFGTIQQTIDGMSIIIPQQLCGQTKDICVTQSVRRGWIANILITGTIMAGAWCIYWGKKQTNNNTPS